MFSRLIFAMGLLLCGSLSAGVADGKKLPAGVSDVVVKQVEPRVWSCDFKSDKVPKAGKFTIVLPEGFVPNGDKSPRVPVIYFLHGLGRSDQTLLDAKVSEECRARVLAAKCAVVMPNSRASWYVNSLAAKDERYADYLDDVMKLAEALFPVSTEARHRGIGGWSMGGYGTMYTAARRPDDFAAAAAIIGILDYPRVEIEPKNLNYKVRPCYGTDPEVWKTFNPRLQVAKLKRVPLFVAFAIGAPERQMNAAFIESAKEAGCSVEELRLPGGHQFSVVEKAFPAVMDFLEKRIEKP